MRTAWNTIRVFISSTFRDMSAERDYLVRFIFPKLRLELLKRRIHFVDVDLRWGVTSDQDAYEVCMEEIDLCRPRFICILGGRYGWIPRAAEELSITASEILYGALSHPEQVMFRYFYFREPSVTRSIPEPSAKDYREPEDSFPALALEKLKARIITSQGQTLVAPGKIAQAPLPVYTYPCNWNSASKRIMDLEEFGNHVFTDLLRSVDYEFGKETPSVVDPIQEERDAMEAFIESRSNLFVLGNRQPVLEQLIAHADGVGENGYLVLTGDSGTGKSALLSHFCREYTEHTLKDSAPAFIIPHFIGASSASTNIRKVLQRICYELSGAAGLQEVISDDYNKLHAQFPDLLTRIPSSCRIVIVLDAVNQLDSMYQAHELLWLPEVLPQNVRIILSTIQDERLEQLRTRLKSPAEIQLPPLEESTSSAIIQKFTSRYRKTLDKEQRSLLLQKEERDKPLYLLTVLEELRTLGTYEEITARILNLPGEIQPLYGWILDRLETDPIFRSVHGNLAFENMVARFCSCIATSRAGIGESDLVELIDPGDPEGNVAALQRLLRPYLMQRADLIDFFHIQLRDAVIQKYLPDEDSKIKSHRNLANFFLQKADPENNSTWNGDHSRAFHELPYHLFCSNSYKRLFHLAHDRSFLAKQEETFPEEPELPLQTIQFGLQAAAELDDAASCADLLITHAQQLWNVEEQSPLDAVRAGNLQRALQLIELMDPERRLIWTLLLAWELMETGDTALARDALARALRAGLPSLSSDQWQYASYLVLQLLPLQDGEWPSALTDLAEPGMICDMLNRRGEFALAIQFANQAQQLKYRSELLLKIAAAQSGAGEKSEATATCATILQALQQDNALLQQQLPAVISMLISIPANELAIEASFFIEDEIQRSKAMYWIAQSFAAEKNFDAALSLAKRIPDAFTETYLIKSIAESQVAAGDAEGAARTIRKSVFTDEEEKVVLLLFLTNRPVAAPKPGHNGFILAAHQASNFATFEERAKSLAESARYRASSWGPKEGSVILAASFEVARQITDWNTQPAREVLDLYSDFADSSDFRDLCRKYWSTHPAKDALLSGRNSDRIKKIVETEDLVRSALWIPAPFAQSKQQISTEITDCLKAGNFDGAFHLAETAENEPDRMLIHQRIAEAQEREGQISAARETLARGLRKKKIVDFLGHYAIAQIATGEYQEAARELESLPNLSRELLFKEILEGFEILKEHSGALKLIEALQKPWSFKLSLVHIAKIYAREGLFDKAMKATSRIRDEVERSAGFAEIAMEHLKRGDEDTAHHTYKKIRDPGVKARVWIDIASMFMNSGNRKKAEKMLQKAIPMAERISEERIRDRILIRLAKAWAMCGNIGATQDLLKRVSQTLDFARPEWKDHYLLLEIAEAYAETGDRNGAQRAFREYFEETKNSAKDYLKFDHLIGMARVCIHAGESDLTALALEQAQDLLTQNEQLKNMIDFADCCVQAGQTDRAREILLKVLNVERRSWQSTSQAHTVAAGLAKLGFGADAVEISKSIVTERATRVPAIAWALGEVGDRKNFKRLLKDCC